MNTVNMAHLSRCEIFSTSPLDGKALDGARTPGIELNVNEVHIYMISVQILRE